MPITYEFDRDTAFTPRVRETSPSKVFLHFAELEKDTALPTRIDVLLDFTPTESLPDSGQLRAVAGEIDRIRSRFSWRRFAIVADRDAMYGMTRMLQVFAENAFATSQVFRDLEEARSWLYSVPSS